MFNHSLDMVETQFLANYTMEELEELLKDGWEIVFGNLENIQGILILERRTPFCLTS